MTTKASFASFETSGGSLIHRIPLEAFPKFWVYAYLLQSGRKHILIDCGSGTESSHKNLLDGLEQAGLRPSDLNYILLTHAHIDHFGGLSKLKPLTTAKVGCHELDVQTVAHHEARLALISRRLASYLAEAGLAEEPRDQLLSIYRFTKAIYQSVPVDFTYNVDESLLGLEMIHLPGHCPGHVALRMEDVLFCGDMVVEGVTPHISPEFINPYSGLDHYLASLAKLLQWSHGARLIFNGHNEVITDLSVQIETTLTHLMRRLGKALHALEQPLTIAETCQAVYGEIGGYNGLLVIERTGAYIEYLYEHGMIEIANTSEMEQGKPAKYRRLQAENVLLEELSRRMNVEIPELVTR